MQQDGLELLEASLLKVNTDSQTSQDGPQAIAHSIDLLLIIHMKQRAPSLEFLVKC